VCTVSDYSKREIVECLKVNPKKIFVLRNGLGSSFVNANNVIDNEFMKKEKYILNVGSIEPRKNIKFLLEVFFTLKKIQSNIDLKLVLTGAESWASSDVFSLIKNSEFFSDILLLGHIDDVKLPPLYRNARAMVFPSIAEGFGIPVVESLSQGTPVIVNNNTSLGCFKSYGATVLNNFDVNDWSIKLDEIIRNFSRVSERDIQNVKKSFSWKVSAKKLVQKIDMVV